MKTCAQPNRPAWLQNVPAEWSVPLLRLVARVESGHTPSRGAHEYWVPEECTIPWFSLADIWQLRDGRQKYLGETKELISPAGVANSAARILPPGTVILSRTASVGFSGIMPKPMATTQDFVNFICGDRLIPDYLLWVLRGMKTEFERLSLGSTHMTIYMPDLLQFRVPLPPLKTQLAIADYLDRKIAAVDAIIEKKEHHIALLAERKQALITARIFGAKVLVASSLQRTLEGRPPGWEVMPLWSCFAPVKEQGFPNLGLLSVYRDYGVIYKDSREDNHNRAGEDLAIYQRVVPGDVVFNRMKAWQGSVAVSDLLGIVSPDYQVLRPRSEFFDKAYLHHLLRSSVYIAEYARLSKGIRPSQWRLMYDEMRTLPLLIPPLSVQAQIAAEISKALDAGSGVASLVLKEIDRLHEYRQALITATVTGQLDIGESPHESH